MSGLLRLNIGCLGGSHLATERSCSAPSTSRPLRVQGGRPLRRIRHDPIGTVCSATVFDSSDPDQQVTVAEARQLLGVNPTSSFDEILAAKNRLQARHGGDSGKLTEIESAYDLLLSFALRRRIAGEVEVSTSVRYADVPPNPREKKISAMRAAGGASASSSSRQSIPLPVGGLALAVPQQATATPQAAVFGALSVWALVQTLLENPEAQLAETAGLQMALAFGYSMYSLKENKRMALGKAAGVTFGCLVLGALVGSAFNSWVRPDIVPIGGFGSPGTFVTEFIILFIGLGAAFLV